jgi:hypothetical protein
MTMERTVAYTRSRTNGECRKEKKTVRQEELQVRGTTATRLVSYRLSSQAMTAAPTEPDVRTTGDNTCYSNPQAKEKRAYNPLLPNLHSVNVAVMDRRAFLAGAVAFSAALAAQAPSFG